MKKKKKAIKSQEKFDVGKYKKNQIPGIEFS